MADFREYSAAFQDHQNDLAHYGIPKSRWSPEARSRYDSRHRYRPESRGSYRKRFDESMGANLGSSAGNISRIGNAVKRGANGRKKAAYISNTVKTNTDNYNRRLHNQRLANEGPNPRLNTSQIKGKLVGSQRKLESIDARIRKQIGTSGTTSVPTSVKNHIYEQESRQAWLNKQSDKDVYENRLKKGKKLKNAIGDKTSSAISTTMNKSRGKAKTQLAYNKKKKQYWGHK